MRIFRIKPIDKIRILVSDARNAQKAEELTRAKGVMNNYLRDKNLSVKFKDSIFDINRIDMYIYSKKRAMGVYTVHKETKDTPFLRLVYKVLENISKK